MLSISESSNCLRAASAVDACKEVFKQSATSSPIWRIDVDSAISRYDTIYASKQCAQQGIRKGELAVSPATRAAAAAAATAVATEGNTQCLDMLMEGLGLWAAGVPCGIINRTERRSRSS